MSIPNVVRFSVFEAKSSTLAVPRSSKPIISFTPRGRTGVKSRIEYRRITSDSALRDPSLGEQNRTAGVDLPIGY